VIKTVTLTAAMKGRITVRLTKLRSASTHSVRSTSATPPRPRASHAPSS
jgi:hypothetical protein